MKNILSLLAVVVGLQACAHPDPMLPALTSSPDFAPVYPLVQDQTKPATGGIYGNRQSDAWFGRGRNYQVGDLITVILNESTQAARSQGTDISKDASNTALPTSFSKFIGGVGANSPITGIDLNKSTTKSTGKGSADQQASLTGSITVTVIEVLANGNLAVRGEKKTRPVRRYRSDSSRWRDPSARRGSQWHGQFIAFGQCTNCLPWVRRLGQCQQTRLGHLRFDEILALLILQQVELT